MAESRGVAMPEGWEKVTDLMRQLQAVQEIAERGYWLTTEELGQVLGLPESRLAILREQPLAYEFPWRNFRCCVVDEQEGIRLWSITPNKAINVHTPTTAPQKQPAVYARVDNFLPRDKNQQLLEYAIANEGRFVPSRNSADDSEYRRSWVLYDFPEFSGVILHYVQMLIPQVLKSLKMEPFPIAYIECQMTAHNHGNYYKVHNDNGSPDAKERELTYVYYFYREPKQFSGGELLIYDSEVRNNMYVKADTYKTYVPANNTIIFFPSYLMHEVLPVTCPSRQFADSRFTVNGWVRRK
ncbi:2OG-Fe(II) oxygenase [Synechococcus sp. JA-3-3Ab]|nr:oxidoreductase, 2OG-Fe(II) oxygenase family [Synechococcus sp. JA-3-3Ab]